MKTKILVLAYILTKLLILATFFVRLEGGRLARARRRCGSRHD